MTIHIKKAYFCLNCETIFERELLKEDCPACASFSVWPMESWICGTPEFKRVDSETNLSNKHLTALMAVMDGADVFNLITAKALRECEKFGFVEICSAMGEYDPLKQLPYFGAITTRKGKEFITEVSVNG